METEVKKNIYMCIFIPSLSQVENRQTLKIFFFYFRPNLMLSDRDSYVYELKTKKINHGQLRDIERKAF